MEEEQKWDDPEWCAQHFAKAQAEARERIAMRKYLPRTLNDEAQFDYDREAEQQGISTADLMKGKP